MSSASQWQSIWVTKFKNWTAFVFVRSHRNFLSMLSFCKMFLLRFVFLNRLNLMLFNFTTWVRCIFKDYTCSSNFLLFYGFTITCPVTSVCRKCFLLHSTTHFSVRLAIWLSQMLNTGTGSNSISLILKQLTSSAKIPTHHTCRVMHLMHLGSCHNLTLLISHWRFFIGGQVPNWDLS